MICSALFSSTNYFVYRLCVNRAYLLLFFFSQHFVCLVKYLQLLRIQIDILALSFCKIHEISFFSLHFWRKWREREREKQNGVCTSNLMHSMKFITNSLSFFKKAMLSGVHDDYFNELFISIGITLWTTCCYHSREWCV